MTTNDGTFHSILDSLQYEYTKLGNILSAETYRADTAEGEAFATNLRLVEVLKELYAVKKELYDIQHFLDDTGDDLSTYVGSQ